MPFKSEKQRRLLWAKHPDIAKRWAHEYPESNKNLPMYADKKENKTEGDKAQEKDAQIATARALLMPLLARFQDNRAPISKKSESILAHVEMPETDHPTAAGDKHLELTGTRPGVPEREQEGTEILCSNGVNTEKEAELQKIAQILRKKAVVLSHDIRGVLGRIMEGVNQGLATPGGSSHGTGMGSGRHLDGHALASGLAGRGGVNGQGTHGQGQNLGPAPPKGSFFPKNVGEGYTDFLQSANTQLTQTRMNSLVPPPMGSQPPSVVATYPGMNSTPKIASNIAGSSLGSSLKAIQPISGHFQLSNLVSKGQSQFAKGNDGLLNTIGKLSPFKTENGKTDITAGLSGGAYGNLPNTPKTNHLG